MGTRENLIAGMAVGSGIMFLLDPQAGGRRRALVRDKSVRWSRQTGRMLRTSWRRLEGTSRGVAAGVRHFRAGGEAVVDDRVLEQRLRTCIGRHCSHPRAVEVAVRDGSVTLSGPVLSAEAREVLGCASEVRGVRAVDNRLELHEAPGTVPALQGEPRRRGWSRWAPGWQTATATAAAGIGMLLVGRRLLAPGDTT
jgi:hypothetical protein